MNFLALGHQARVECSVGRNKSVLWRIGIKADAAFLWPGCLLQGCFSAALTADPAPQLSNFTLKNNLSDADQRGEEANREQNLHSVSGEHLRGDSDQTALPICQS